MNSRLPLLRGLLALAIERDPASRQILVARLQQVSGLRLLDTIESWPASLDDRPCNLIVMGLDPDFERNLGRIQILTRSRPDLAILPVSTSPDSDRILRAVRAGACSDRCWPPPSHPSHPVQIARSQIADPAVELVDLELLKAVQSARLDVSS